MVEPLWRWVGGKPTGRFRHRVGFRGVLILQAELVYHYIQYPTDDYSNHKSKFEYRDATQEELESFEKPVFLVQRYVVSEVK